ncbi:hypothetical protein [Acidisarcina polymorpha]|uniref:hypothetical protein n=1 Tax=Acidisarcina polymorpha TaxID=2211140 RepID=UPI000DEF2748|nr:hypothetical protein [Acidisarcina polymorpha]
MRPGSSQLRNYWIWYIGSGVWLLDAALALHLDHRNHALAAVGVALLFLVAGAVWRKKWNRLQ